MHPPPIDDIIVAISTAWTPSAVGVLRLSGQGSLKLVESLEVAATGTFDRSSRSHPVTVELRLDDDSSVPARLLKFHAPRSFTGQDVVEIHTIGCLPLLRRLSELLIERGARRALPGEFTARAYLNRKLSARGVERIAELISAADRDAARTAARSQRESYEPFIERLRGVLVDTLAAIEAGIDFVDEEDVRFIDGARVVEALAPIIERLTAFRATSGASCESKPHVALAGRANAGKSTLFNRLCGVERAIVSPQIGTTRDVLSVELQWGGMTFVLQDCAGLSDDGDELEIAAYRAAERAADRADVILWLHDIRAEWTTAERRAMESVGEERCVVVLSQLDRANAEAPLAGRNEAPNAIEISAASGAGLAKLRAALISRLAQRSIDASDPLGPELATVHSALQRARDLAHSDPALAAGELVALEIRTACEHLDRIQRGPLVEDVLGRIFSAFCIGK